MKSILFLIALTFTTVASSSFAGYGAIAYNSFTGANGEAHGFASYQAAAQTALNYCGVGCTVVAWELNSCIALATGNGRWGEAHGYQNAQAAAVQAIYQCGPGCTLTAWACN